MSNSPIGGNFQFPDLNIASSKKDKEWHKKYVLAITNRALNSGFDLDYHSIEVCQDYYNGDQDQEAFDFLQEAADGDKLPAFWTNYNKVKSKIDLILGEYIKKDYNIKVSSVNRDAKVRKLEQREDARVNFRLSPYVNNLEAEFGIPLQQGQAFENEEEIDDFYDYSYKEKSEVVMKGALDYSLRRQRWDYERKAIARDLLITGRCFSKTELINGIPKTRRIDPKFMIWDRNSTDDFLTDSTYFGEVRYMNIAEAAQKYNLDENELKSSYNSQRNIHKSTNPNRYKRINEALGSSSLSFFKEERGELRVLILEAYWVDFEKMRTKFSVDSRGNEHYRTLSNETSSNKNIRSNFYKVWRKGVLVGGEFIKDYGIIKNMPRSIDDPADTGCPYKGCVVNYVNSSNTSIVSLIKPLQDLKNIAMYNLQLAMASAGSRGFVYDVAQVPDGWDVHNVMKYLKQSGIAFINSAQNEGMGTGFNQFQPIDMSLGNEVNKYLEISAALDAEMDQITGINEARQGIVQNASQAVGVTQSALFQSSLTTEVFFNSLRLMSSDIYSYTCGLIKVAWPQYKDRFSYIIGDNGVNFLVDDLDLDLDDYAVFVEDVPPSISDLQSFQAIVQTALQSQSIGFVEAVKMLKETDVDRGIRMLERQLEIKERENQKRAQEERQIQQEQLSQQIEAEAQSQEREFQKEVALKNIDSAAKKEQAIMQSKFSVILERIKNNYEKSRPVIESTGEN